MKLYTIASTSRDKVMSYLVNNPDDTLRLVAGLKLVQTPTLTKWCTMRIANTDAVPCAIAIAPSSTLIWMGINFDVFRFGNYCSHSGNNEEGNNNQSLHVLILMEVPRYCIWNPNVLLLYVMLSPNNVIVAWIWNMMSMYINVNRSCKTDRGHTYKSQFLEFNDVWLSWNMKIITLFWHLADLTMLYYM